MQRFSTILLILLAALLLLQMGFSAQWPIAHDEAPLFYEAFLMHSEGRVPYRDIFDFQMPGSFAAFYLFGPLTGFGPLRIRILDLLILVVLFIITYGILRAVGKPPAFAAGILFGLKYLQGGPSMALQREYLLLLFIAPAVWISMRSSLTLKSRFALGVLFGLAAAIKPHAAIGLLPILLFDIIERIKSRGVSPLPAVAGSVLPAVLGFSAPLLLMTAWLASTNSLTSFVSIAAKYWPLYAQINGQMEINTGAERISFVLNQAWRLGGNGLWLLPASIGVYGLPQNRKRPAYLLAGIAACYAIYPAFSGQFFPYHYLPFVYFILSLASLCLSASKWQIGAAMVLVLAILLNVRPSSAFLRQVEGKPIVTSTDRAEQIARFLEKNLERGDTVQPLDWTGGTLLAMLETRAHLATPYVFDFYFYHHISDPYIQSLRADFLDDLQEARPRFIVEVTAIDKPWITGKDASREFPALRAFLDEHYSITIRKDDYVIYERQ
jgi:hypothetical protein